MNLLPILLEFDLERSLVVVAGEYRWPAVIPVCPPDDDGRPYADHALWAAPTGGPPPCGVQPDFDVWIPTEAGLLVQLVEHSHPSAGTNNPHLELRLDARTCEMKDGMWLPYSLTLRDGAIVAGSRFWDEAEPAWIAEFMGYLGGRPYVEPAGPSVTLERLGWQAAATETC